MDAIILRRTKITLVMVVVARLVRTSGILGTPVAQKAAVPKPQDKFAVGEDEAKTKQSLLLIDTDKNGRISKQGWMKFMEGEVDRLDKAKTAIWTSRSRCNRNCV